MDPIKLTPEQEQALKVANAHGFINQRVHDAGRTPEQAQEDLKRAYTIYERHEAKLASEIPKVIEVVRSHIKSTAAA